MLAARPLPSRATSTRRHAARRRSTSLMICRSSTQTSLASAAAAAAASLLLSGAALAEELPMQGVFAMKCAGCHMNGGNVVQAGATLFAEDLERNGVSSPEALYNIIYFGKGKMPGYGADCTPKGKCTFGPRLSDAEIAGLASFVQRGAATKWQ